MRNADGGGRARVLPRFVLAIYTGLLTLACQGGAPPADAAEEPTRSAAPAAPEGVGAPRPGSDPHSDGTGMQNSPSDSLRLRIDLPDRARPGEAVPITFRVENVTDRTLTLHLMGRDIAFDVIVERVDGGTVWRRLEGEVLQAILRIETLAPGEALVLEALWHQRSNAGQPVPPGEYSVRAELPTEGESLLSPTRPLVIADA